MALKLALLDILACPLCKGKVKYDQQGERLLCLFDRLAYPVKQHIPVLIVEEATALDNDECAKWRS